MSFLEKEKVHVTFLRIFQQRNGRFISAKILNVSEECSSIVEKENFWPPGVNCRRWISNKDWHNRISEVSSDTDANGW